MPSIRAARSAAAGVRAGTSRLVQSVAATPRRPASDKVGTSGRKDERRVPLVARMRMRPSRWPCSIGSLRVLMQAGIAPPITSCRAGPPPL